MNIRDIIEPKLRDMTSFDQKDFDDVANTVDNWFDNPKNASRVENADPLTLLSAIRDADCIRLCLSDEKPDLGEIKDLCNVLLSELITLQTLVDIKSEQRGG